MVCMTVAALEEAMNVTRLPERGSKDGSVTVGGSACVCIRKVLGGHSVQWLTGWATCCVPEPWKLRLQASSREVALVIRLANTRRL
eukprot:1155395-Pelagomonas_calceolata.AAC.3